MALITVGLKLAERVGFEPTLPFRVNTLSKRAPSATRPSLRRKSGRTIAPEGYRIAHLDALRYAQTGSIHSIWDALTSANRSDGHTSSHRERHAASIAYSPAPWDDRSKFCVLRGIGYQRSVTKTLRKVFAAALTARPNHSRSLSRITWMLPHLRWRPRRKG
jgi:hypothetical protein